VALQNQGRIQAIDSLADEAAQALGPDSDVPARVRAWGSTGLDRRSAADSLARSAPTRFGDRPSARTFFSTVLGRTVGLGGRLKEAERYRVQADSARSLEGIEADPLNTALVAASDRAFFLGDQAGARTAALAALRRFPQDSLAEDDRNYGGWGWLLHIAGATEAAREMERKLAARYARSNRRADARQLARLRAGLALDERRYADAITGLTNAIVAFPEAGIGLYGPTLAEAYQKHSQPDSAIAVLNQYLQRISVSADNNAVRYIPWSMQRLGELYDSKGDYARALDAYERFVDLWKEADPELQPTVRDVQGRIERLRRLTYKG
jgi:eukaryotic-like serine/threonine-protein kinase